MNFKTWNILSTPLSKSGTRLLSNDLPSRLPIFYGSPVITTLSGYLGVTQCPVLFKINKKMGGGGRIFETILKDIMLTNITINSFCSSEQHKKRWIQKIFSILSEERTNRRVLKKKGKNIHFPDKGSSVMPLNEMV